MGCQWRLGIRALIGQSGGSGSDGGVTTTKTVILQLCRVLGTECIGHLSVQCNHLCLSKVCQLRTMNSARMLVVM
jgi:hypothetical protein